MTHALFDFVERALILNFREMSSVSKTVHIAIQAIWQIYIIVRAPVLTLVRVSIALNVIRCQRIIDYVS